MGFREPLDLSSIMDSYKHHLNEHSSTAGINFIRSESASPEPKYEPIPERLYRPSWSVGDDPMRVGNGPAACSTDTTLVSTRPAFAWDVNGWYRRLKVPFPYVHVPAGALAKYYLEVDGPNDARSTYYLKRLLDKEIRAEYDAMQLGDTYLDDEYVQMAIKAMAAAEASRRSAEGTYTDPADVMDEWGYKVEPNSEEALDTDSGAVHDDDTPEPDPYEPIEWTYAYWVWRARPNAITIARLEQWQSMLISAFSSVRVRTSLTVGLLGKQPHPYAVGMSEGRTIMYLNEQSVPTPELAARAVNAYLQTPSQRQITQPNHPARLTSKETR